MKIALVSFTDNYKSVHKILKLYDDFGCTIDMKML